MQELAAVAVRLGWSKTRAQQARGELERRQQRERPERGARAVQARFGGKRKAPPVVGLEKPEKKKGELRIRRGDDDDREFQKRFLVGMKSTRAWRTVPRLVRNPRAPANGGRLGPFGGFLSSSANCRCAAVRRYRASIVHSTGYRVEDRVPGYDELVAQPCPVGWAVAASASCFSLSPAQNAYAAAVTSHCVMPASATTPPPASRSS